MKINLSFYVCHMTIYFVKIINKNILFMYDLREKNIYIAWLKDIT
jgi:hypothetical protein